MVLAHDDHGSGPVVLLLHSGVCDRRMWRPQIEALQQTHRVVAPDLAGFGDSPLEPGPFSFTDDVIELLDALAIPQAIVVGSSFGGRLALELTHEAPDRVAALALLCPAYRGLDATPAADAFEEAEEELLEANDIDGAVELNLTTWLGPEADNATRGLVRTMQRHAFDVQLAADEWPEPPEPKRVDPDLKAIAVQTLVVTGSHDMDHFQAIARHVSSEIPNAKLVELSWAGHLPSIERPAETTELLRDFLGGLNA